MSLGRAVVGTGGGRELPSVPAEAGGSSGVGVGFGGSRYGVCAGRGFFLLRAFVWGCVRVGLLFLAGLCLEVRG